MFDALVVCEKTFGVSNDDWGYWVQQTADGSSSLLINGQYPNCGDAGNQRLRPADWLIRQICGKTIFSNQPIIPKLSLFGTQYNF
jgi:hypothetical protein